MDWITTPQQRAEQRHQAFLGAIGGQPTCECPDCPAWEHHRDLIDAILDAHNDDEQALSRR